MKTDELTHEIIGAAMKVHSVLGPGLLESAYRACLCHELGLRGLRYQKELPVPIRYLGLIVEVGYRLDILVEDLVVVEVKAISKPKEVHEQQLLSHLTMGHKSVGLLINFHVTHLRHGIKRMVNNYKG
jgi:GxxExxY protein